MKKIVFSLFLTISLSFSSISKSTLEINTAPFQNAQLKANFAFFTWYCAYLEYISVTQLLAILAKALDLNAENEKYAQSPTVCLSLQEMARNLEDIFKRRSAAINIHNVILNVLMNSEDPELVALISQAAQNATEKITEKSALYAEDIKIELATLSNSIEQFKANLQNMQNVVNSLTDSYSAINMAELGHEAVNAIEAHSMLFLSLAQKLRSLDIELQMEGLEIFRQSYETIYAFLVTNNYPEETYKLLATPEQIEIFTFNELPDPSMLVIN